MRFVVAALVIALGGGPGCSCTQRDTFAGGAGDAGGRDGAPAEARPDGGRRDGGTGACEREGAWRLEPRPIAGIELMPGPAPRMGVTEQLLVTVGLSHACEELAWVTVEVQRSSPWRTRTMARIRVGSPIAHATRTPGARILEKEEV